LPAGAYVGQWLRESPPRIEPGRFSLDRVVEKVAASVEN